MIERSLTRTSRWGALVVKPIPLLRRAVEVHAEDVAIEVLKAEGYSDILRIGKPYDLRALRIDGEELHVEVKGSMLRVDSVILTPNEVRHADDHATSLIVVDEIEVTIGDGGSYECSGGRVRRWDSWSPAPEALTPSQYIYALPGETHRDFGNPRAPGKLHHQPTY